MKKNLLIMLTVLLASTVAMGQAPNIFNYQGVARNSVGNVLINKTITIRLTILNNSPAGPIVYQESRSVTTNPFGLFNLQVGDAGATNVTGTIAGVPWGVGNKYIRVEVDPNGGTTFLPPIGTAQLASVPYAIFATTAGDLTLPFIRTQAAAGSTLIGLTNSATTGTQGAFAGTSASNDGNAFAITGTISSASPGGFSAGVRGINSGTGGLGIGVYGSQAGSGWGVYGTTPGGIGVHGNSATGFGVYGLSTSGTGVYGNSSTGGSGFFETTNNANASNALGAATNGSGNAVNGVSTGTGRGGNFVVNNAASTADALRAETNGTGASWAIRGISTGTNGAGLFVQSNATNTSNNLQSNQAGLGRAGLFNSTNAASTVNAVEVNAAGSGASLVANTTGTGSAGIFNATSAANGSNTLLVDNANVGNIAFGNASALVRRGPVSLTTFSFINTPTAITGMSTTGIGMQGNSETGLGVGAITSSGVGLQAVSVTTGTALVAQAAGTTGIAGDFLSSNAANTTNVIRAVNANAANGATSAATGGGNTIFARKGAALTAFLNNPSGVYATSSAAAGIGIAGITSTNIGTFGGTITTGSGVVGQTFGVGGAALFGIATSSATSFALVTAGRVQIQGQGAAANRVLTSDAIGNATWQALGAIGGGVGGSGTLNFIPKWTPDGNTLGNSQVFDDGTNVGVGTNIPTSKLHVLDNTGTGLARNISLETNTTIAGIRITPTAAINTGGLSITNAAGTLHNAQLFFGTGGGYNNHMVLTTSNSGATGDITINKATTNVGIGKTNAAAKLELGPISQANNTYIIASGFNLVTGIASSDNSAVTAQKTGVYAFSDGSTTNSQSSVFAEAGTTSPTRNSAVTGRVSFAPTGAGPSTGIRAQDAVNGSNTWAISISGRMQYQDGTEGAGKILTSDAAGNASWQDLITPDVHLNAGSTTASTNIPSGLFTQLKDWGNMDEGGGANWNPGTGEYTITVAGVYSVFLHVDWTSQVVPAGTPVSANAAGSIYLNGVSIHHGNTGPLTVGAYIQSSIAQVEQRFAVGDKITFYAFQSTGSALIVGSGIRFTKFGIHLLHK